MKKKIGLCLSGCGMNDGSEIHESVITILALDLLNIDIIYMAPNVNQKIVNNHLINSNSNETRNVLTESARISRGNILDIVDAEIIGYTELQNCSTRLFGINANSSRISTLTDSPRPASELVVLIPILLPFANFMEVFPYSKTPGLR